MGMNVDDFLHATIGTMKGEWDPYQQEAERRQNIDNEAMLAHSESDDMQTELAKNLANFARDNAAGTFLARFGNAGLNTYGGTLNFIGNLIDNDAITKAGNNLLDASEIMSRDVLKPERKAEMSLDYVLDSNGMLSAAADLGGSIAAFAPAGIGANAVARGVVGKLLPYAGRVAQMGGRMAAAGNTLRGTATGATGLLSQKALQYAPEMFTGAAMKNFEGTSEAGSYIRDKYNEYKKQGMSDDEAMSKARETALEDAKDILAKNVALLTATGAVEGLIGGRVLRNINKLANKGGVSVPSLVNYAGDMVAGNAIQAYEEGAQQGIQDNKGKGWDFVNPNNWSDESWESAKSALAGQVPFDILGLGGYAAGRVANRRENDEITPQRTGMNKETSIDDNDNNAKAVIEQFRKAGYNDDAIAGIMGRVQQEHNFNTSNVEEYDTEDGTHLGGYGMFQWNGGRKDKFLKWCEDNKRNPQDAYAQADFALIEAEERGLTPEHMNKMSPEEAARVWTDKWEVGEHGAENQYANEWKERLNNGYAEGISDYSNEANEDMYADFAENLLNTSTDADTVNEVSSMFDDNDNFINTPENRKTLWEKHGEEMQQYYNDRMESGKKQTAEIAENAMQEETPAPAELKTPTAPKGSANLNAPISFTNAPTGTISRVEGLSDKGGNVNAIRPRSMPIELSVPTQEAQEPQRTYQYNPQRGRELLQEAQKQNINLSRRLQAGLEKGYPKAIETAEAGIKSHIENSVIPEQETQEAPQATIEENSTVNGAENRQRAGQNTPAGLGKREIISAFMADVLRINAAVKGNEEGKLSKEDAIKALQMLSTKVSVLESSGAVSDMEARNMQETINHNISRYNNEGQPAKTETPKKTAKERADEIKNKIDGVEEGIKNGTIDYAMASELIGDIKKEIADAKAKDEITAAMAEKLSSRADKVLAKAKPAKETAKQEEPSEGNESGTLYFKNDNDDYVYAEYGPNTNRTKDYVLNFAKEKGFTQQVSKVEFEKHNNDKFKKQAEERMKKLFEAGDIEGIIDMLKSNDNVWSRDAFSELSGVKLSPKQGERLKQVKDYYGDKYTKWQEEKAKADKEKEQQEIKKQDQKKKEETEAAEKDWNDGKYITGDEFLLLCDKYEVNVPISTKGTLKNKIQGIRNDGQINTATKKYPQGVSNVYHQLKEQMAQDWMSEEDAKRFMSGEKVSFIKDKEDKQQKAEDMKSGKAWENVINKDRVDNLTDEEMKVVDAIFSGKGPQIVSTNGQEKAEEAPKAEEPKKETPKAETEKTGFEGGFAGAGKYLRKKNKAQKEEIKLVNVFNEDELDDEIAKLADELNNLSANPVFNPNVYKSLLKIGGIYVQKGINKFAQWADKMVDAFTAKGVDESKIRPWLTSVWEGLSSYPSNFRFDDDMMAAFVQAIGELHNEGVTDYKDVLKRFNEEYEAEDVKQLEPVIKAAYNGIEKFFTDMKEVQGNEQREQSKGTDGRHEGIQSERSRGNERESTGEVSERGGRKGEELSGSTRGENTERPATSGIREGTELETSAGNGDNQRGNTGEVSLTPAQANPSPTETPGHDYEIKKSAEGKKSAAVRFKQNIEAIKLLKQLETDDRMPTPKEQEILAAYNGWGSLTNAFMDGTKENKELKELLTSEEYDAALSSSRDAFYTPPAIVRAIWEGVSRLGFNGGRILDPSMGVGNFFGTMPRDMMKNSTMTGVELDNLSSRFAKMLYPSAYVENTGFQKASAANNFFDLVISNIPFGQKKIQGYQVHNYFFANGIDKVRPGGLMVYITSQGSLASGKDAERMRTYLSQKADLIAAYKLPSGTFEDAGTGVTTDIVIFQKRGVDGVQSPHAQNFLTVNRKGSYYDGYNVNEYFDSHEENIIGETSVGRDQFGNKALQVKPTEGMNIAKELSKAMKKLPTVYEQVDRSNQPQFNPANADKKARADEKTRDLEYYVKDGKVVQNQNGEAVAVTGKTAATIKDYIKIKDALNSLFIAQRDPKATDSQLKTLRDNLNKAYDSFVKKYGYLNGAVSRVFKQDPSAGMVMALEKTTFEGKKLVGVEKSDIFTTRTMSAVQEVTSAKTPDDAFLASLANRGRVDVDYMAKLLGSTPDKVVSALKGKIFKNPATEAYESRDEYLSGNVREKLAQAETAAKQDKSYQGNVDELKKVIPEDFVSDEIIVNMGAPWIPESDVQDFVNYLVGNDDSMKVKFLQGAAKWVVAGYGRNARFNADGIKLDEMLECILNNKPIRIYEGRGDDRRYDEKKSDAAEMVANDLRSEFNRWLWSDKEREKRLVRYYNDNYNNMVPRTYDGSHLDPHAYGMNNKIKLKPHQKDVVWRIIQSGNTLIAHCVGAGKTFEMQTAGMEMRRLGLANKPMYCLPNNVVEQFAREFRTLYPAAKLLVLQSSDIPAVPKSQYKTIKHEDGRKETIKVSLKDLPKAERQKIIDARTARNRILSRIQTEDWDGIILSHNMFQRFPLTPETTASFIQEQIDVLERTIIEAKGANMNKRDIKTLEDKKDKLKEKYDSVLSSDLDDIGIPFEQLGIDQLFVDEADMFKNLYFPTTLGDIHGISNTDAARSNDMFAKTQWLSRTLNGRGVVFATGTPISNTISEEFTMLRYLDMRGLKEKGLDLFDNWIRTFGDIGQDLERKPDGSGFRFVTKVKSFINIADLTKMFTKVADIKRQEDLNLDIPKLKNDKATVVKLEPDAKVVDYIKNVVPERIRNMGGVWRKEKGADNMLSLTNDLRKLSMTDGKINACADQIAKKFEETSDIKGAQLVFCDIGIPKTDKTTESETDTVDNESEKENSTTYEKLIKALQKRGIPKEQIAFVQSAKNKAQMDALFQKVDKGEVRILIGSTQKMGAGTNCQHHLVALHDLDAPWRPRDLEQRHGRILRQGNPNKTVEIFNYVVQDSFDAIMWEKLKNKAAIIAQAMNPNTTLRVVEDADLVTLSYAEVEEAATGNPLIKEQLNLQQEVTKLRHAQTEYKRKIRDAETDMEQYPVKIDALSNAIGKVEKDIANRTDTKGDAFTMKLGSQTFNKRKDAEEALKTILGKFSKNISTEIGEIGGMKVKAMKVASYDVGEETESRIVIQLVGNQAYQVKTNSVVGIENTLQNEPQKVLEDLKQQKARAEKNLEDAKEIVEQPNPYAERLTDAEKRLNDVMYRIKHEMVGDNSQGETETAKAEETQTETPQTETPNETASSTPATEESTKDRLARYKGFKYDGGYVVEETDTYRDVFSGKVDAKVRDYAKEYGGKWEPGVSGTHGRFVFETKTNARNFLRDFVLYGADEILDGTKETPASDNFTAGEFKHTKTGEMIPQAKPEKQVDRDTYKQVAECAKRNGGYWSRYSKSFLFKDASGRDAFIKEADGIMNGEKQFSIDGEPIVATQKGYHGTGADFDRFDITHIGEGEGNQSHGYGIYVAQSKDVAEGYRRKLINRFASKKSSDIVIDGKSFDELLDEVNGDVGRQHLIEEYASLIDGQYTQRVERAIDSYKEARKENDASGYESLYEHSTEEDIKWFKKIAKDVEKQIPEHLGSLFEVEIPQDDVLLDEQKRWRNQPKAVKDGIKKLCAEHGEKGEKALDRITTDEIGRGYFIYSVLSNYLFEQNERNTAEALNKYGIKGITYVGGSDGRCYVIFDDNAIDIINKYSLSQAGEEGQRAVDDVKAEVKDAFSMAKKVKDEGTKLTFTMPNGVEVEVDILDQINLTPAQERKARKQHGVSDTLKIRINGTERVISGKALVELSRLGKKGTSYHEAFHIIYDLLLTQKEKDALKKAYGYLTKGGKQIEEVLADKYMDYMLDQKLNRPTPYAKLMKRIKDFVKDLYNKMRGITDTMREAEKVFQKAESGKVWKRKVEELKDFDTHYAEEHDKSVDNENNVRDNEGEESKQKIDRMINDIRKAFDGVLDMEDEKIDEIFFKNNEVRIARVNFNFFENINPIKAYENARLFNDLGEAFENEQVVQNLRDRNARRAEAARLARDGKTSNAILQGYERGGSNIANEKSNTTGIRGTFRTRTVLSLRESKHIQDYLENNKPKRTSVSRLGKQGGFSNAKDKAYMNAVSKYQNAKSDAEKTAALETLQKMVNEAAKEAGFENAIPEQTRAYTVRTKAAPKKTQKVYKVFTVDDNGRPSALFVSSTDTLPQNVWLDANDTFNFTDQSNGRKYIPSTKNPNSKGGATGKSIKLSDVSEADKAELERLGYIKKNKNGEYPKTITALAYRPGWHAGDLPFFPQGGKQGDGTTNYKNIHRYNQVVFECEMAADVDYTTTSTNSKGQVVFHDMQEMPTDGGYKFATNPMAKAQDIGSWYISGSLKIGRALTEAECNKILAKNGFKPQEWQAYGVGNDFVIGKLDLAKLGYTGEQFDAARKTLAPITYDDDGNVIPLSERFDADKDDIRYSVSVEDEETAPSKAVETTNSWFDKISNKFAKKMSLNADKIKTAARKEEPSIGLYDSIFGSPGRIAKRVAAFKPFFQMADKAMHKLTKLRSDYLKDLGKAMDIVKTDAERQDLTSILWMGDAEGKEYTDDELRANGASDNVIKAYRRIRSLIRRVGDALDDAKRRPQWKTENNVSDAHIEELRKDKFVDPKSIKVSTNADGKKVVSYKEYANHTRTYEGITEEALAQMYADDAIEVLSATKRADDLYDVDVREGFGGLNRLGGYIPHFFHEYMIRLQTSDGKRTVIGSGRTEAEAVKIAEEWLKNNTIPDDAEIFIAPKSANFETLGMKEDAYAPIMGDKDFWKMQKLLAKNNDLTLAEAKEFVNGSIKQKNRHRFYGNFMHRTGAEGFEDNMQWVLRHYVNSAARYIAMETEFKPKAMSLFERLFGAYDKDYSGKDIQQYVKEYINDINGNPSTLETRINKFLNNMNLPFFGKAWQKYVVPKFGDRAALTLASNLTGRVSYLTLGMLNASSALINLTQLMNAAAYTGDVPHLMKRFAQASHGKLGFNDMKVLVQSGVLHDIGIDTGSGYDQNRGYTASGLGKLSKALKLVDTVGKNSMYLFKKVDMLCRVSTVLAAYDKAIAEGKTKQEALEYAKEIDRKSNFEYGVQDAPNVFRRGSILSQLMLQFKKYGFKELEVMGDMLSDKTNSKQKLIFWGLYLLSAGLMGIPAMDWLDDSLEGFGLHFKDTIQKGIMELCGTSEEGKALAKVLMYGGLAAANINVSSRVGLTDVVPTRTSDILGPTVSKLWNFSKDTATGNYAGALRDVSPGLYNIYTAIAGEALGKRGRKNTTYDTMYERLLRAMGFKSVDESLPVDVQRILSNERKERTSERQRMIDDFIENPTGEKARKLKEAGITPKQVQAERDKKKQDRAGRLEGGLQKREKGSYLTEYLK